MQVKDTKPDPHLITMPTTPEESELVQMLFEKITDLRPDDKMGDRTDLAMEMLAVVKRWAHKNEMTHDKAEQEIDVPVVIR